LPGSCRLDDLLVRGVGTVRPADHRIPAVGIAGGVVALIAGLRDVDVVTGTGAAVLIVAETGPRGAVSLR